MGARKLPKVAEKKHKPPKVVERKQAKFLTMKDFRTEIVNWSDDKIRRLIASEALPAMQEPNGRYVFERQQVEDWFKRRTVKP